MLKQLNELKKRCASLEKELEAAEFGTSTTGWQGRTDVTSA
jgi:hypothetical protein